MSEQKYHLIIIGGGFSGLTCALALAKTAPSLQIALIEKSDIINQDKTRDGRAFAISGKSWILFKEIGIADALEKFAGKISDIRITDGNSPFYLHFGNELGSDKSSPLGFVIENFHIHNQLRNRLLECNNVKLLSPASYQQIDNGNDYISVTLDNGTVINSALLIAADGRNSQVREQLKIRTYRKSYGQSALVFNISHEQPHQSIAQERFLPDGPFAVLPMPDDYNISQSSSEDKKWYNSSIVWTTNTAMASILLALDEENFLHQLQKHLDNYLGAVKLASKPFKYDLTLTLSNNYYQNRIALLGDAVHAIHPIAGQGFNLGIDDIITLRNLLVEHYSAGLDIGSKTLLTSYQSARKLPVYRMIAATHGLNWLFSNRNPYLKIARDLGLAAVEKLPQLKKLFIKNAGG